MDLARMIEALSDPAAYPRSHPADAVEVRQTHISVVFLAGPHAYKIKKPLLLGFLDYSTPERRRHCCEQEVRLNRRLAPSVYLGVVPVTFDGTRVEMEGHGEVIEWAVKMERLPDDATLRERLRRGEIGGGQIEGLARRIAAFHARAESGASISAFGRLEVVARNARENFEESESLVGTTISRAVFERLRGADGVHPGRPRPVDRGSRRAGRAPRRPRRPAARPRLPLPRASAPGRHGRSSTASSSTSASAAPTRSPTWPSWRWT